ncbi:MAG: ABC transporter permease [Verrucomicrobia bacterium]|nr:ABC transporter permease [Verrucomicrobiota bacterium]
MLPHLDRKLWRDLRHMKGQVFAVALVMACGLTMLIMARSLIFSLESTQEQYYRAHHFAEVFAYLKRAPNSVLEQVRQIPGAGTVQSGLSAQVTLDIPGLDEPASGNVRSMPDYGEPELNRLYLRKGRWLQPGGRREVLVGEAFANANQLQPGDQIAMLLHGRRQQFRIAGIVLSPEFVFESRPGAALPDNRTYGIFWMPYEELAYAFDLYGAFNFLSLTLEPGASERTLMAALDNLLRPYGGRGSYGRPDHPSHIRVSDEITVLRVLAFAFPLVFLSIGAFMTNAVLSRLLALQREQIAILKAFGFLNRQIVTHYLKFALVMVSLGTILGSVGGVVLGRRLVQIYHNFFRFPTLEFQLDRSALLWALGVSAGAATLGVFNSVRRAATLPPAEAMRPEPPANYRPALVERTGIAHLFSHTFRIAVRNIERKPVQALLTIIGLALATGILIVPTCIREGLGAVLGIKWDLNSRQDVTVGLVEPSSARAQHALGQLPGVWSVEPTRTAVARIRFGHRHRQIGIQGVIEGGLHIRIVEENQREIPLPKNGIVLSSKLADVMGARFGDELTVEFLEGRRLVRNVPLLGLHDDFAGVTAHMEIDALNRLLGEGDVITGATLSVDQARRGDFLRALKGIPSVAWVVIKESIRENFGKTTAASINVIQSIYLTCASIVAFGVVYNNARISLAERSRELATLRVIGFSQREVGAVVVTELVILALIAVPIGLAFGTVLATTLITQVSTETVRLPLVLSPANYAFAVSVVVVASTLSGLFVLRRLNQLNLVGALKAPE